MRTLILLPRAEVDLFDAAVWYEGEREGLGRALESDFDGVIARIHASPLQFPEVEPEVRRAMLSRFPYGVFFVVDDKVITVFAVLHLHPDGRFCASWRQKAASGSSTDVEPKIFRSHLRVGAAPMVSWRCSSRTSTKRTSSSRPSRRSTWACVITSWPRSPSGRGRHRERPARVLGRHGHRHRQDAHVHRIHVPHAENAASSMNGIFLAPTSSTSWLRLL